MFKQKLLSLSLIAATLVSATIIAKEKEGSTNQPLDEKKRIQNNVFPQNRALTTEQKELLLKNLEKSKRLVDIACRKAILKMERDELKKIKRSKREYTRAIRQLDRAKKRGGLSETDLFVMTDNIKRAEEYVKLYEENLDKTIQRRRGEIIQEYHKDLVMLDKMIKDVQKGQFPKIVIHQSYQTRGIAQKCRE